MAEGTVLDGRCENSKKDIGPILANMFLHYIFDDLWKRNSRCYRGQEETGTMVCGHIERILFCLESYRREKKF